MSRRSTRTGFLALGCVLAGACSSSVTVSDVGAPAMDAATEAGTGEIYLRQFETGFIGMATGSTGPGWFVGGFFALPSGLIVDRVVDRCRIRHVEQYLHHAAGAITVTAAGITVTESDAGMLYSAVSLPAGESVRLAAPGAVVPPFETTLTMQSDISVTAPAITPSGVVTASTTTGITIAWVGAPRFVELGFYFGTAEIQCTYPGSAGSATVPGAVFAPFVGAMGGVLLVSSADVVDLSPGGWDVQVRVEKEAARTLIQVQ